jgi:hypothetical protein
VLTIAIDVRDVIEHFELNVSVTRVQHLHQQLNTLIGHVTLQTRPVSGNGLQHDGGQSLLVQSALLFLVVL